MTGGAAEAGRAQAVERAKALSDEVIVERVRAGDDTLFEILMRRHNRLVYRTVRSVLRDENEIEDVLQQAWLSAYSHLAQFQGNARFSTWLVRIALNEALGRRTRGLRLVPTGDGADARAPLHVVAGPSPEEGAASREMAGLVESTLDALPEDFRVVLMLREIEGLDTAATAAALGVSADVVKTRLHRARALLRRRVEERLGAGLAAAFPFGNERCDRLVAAVAGRIAELGSRR